MLAVTPDPPLESSSPYSSDAICVAKFKVLAVLLFQTPDFGGEGAQTTPLRCPNHPSQQTPLPAPLSVPLSAPLQFTSPRYLL